MIKQLTIRRNLNLAYTQVYRNKGGCGVDGVRVDELKSIFQTHGNTYVERIKVGKYQPSPILGIEIPKSNGSTRLLGIPTVIDRVFQQALHQVMQPIFEKDFQPFSFGFRPRRNANQAVTQSLLNINSGYKHLVDIDLKAFFDEVEYYILLELIYKKIKCKHMLKLLRQFLRAPLVLNDAYKNAEKEFRKAHL